MKLLKLTLIVLPFMAIIDGSWAIFIAHDYYASQLGTLLTDTPVVPALVLFYLMYSFAIAYFAVLPALRARSMWTASINGALLGMAAYGTYDLVNLGVLTGYPLSITIVDIIWGMAVTKVCAVIAYFIAKNRVQV